MSRPSNLALIYQNYADRGVLSGGAWQQGSLSLKNLQTPYIAEVARSASANPADTQFNVDLEGFRAVGGVALGPCGVRPDAFFRIRAYLDEARTDILYDSDLIQFPGTVVDSSDLEWEDDGYWDGVTKEFDDLSKGALFIHLLPSEISAKYWRVEIFDQGNPNGYIDIGRLILGKCWQPTYNYDFGNNEFGFDALTDMEESRSGTRFFNPRNIRRTFSFGFSYLPDQETFRDVYRIATRSGIHNQVVVVPSPDDLLSYQREAFIGTLGQAPTLRRPTFGYAATSFKIEESL